MPGAVALVTLLAAGKLAEIDWRAPCALYLVGFIVLAVGVSTLTETKSAGVTTEVAEGGSVRNASGLFLLILLASIVVMMATVQGPFLLSSKGENSPSVQAVIGVLSTLGAMSGASLFGLLRPKIGFSVMLAIVLAALGAGTIGLGMSNGVIAWAVFAALGGFGGGLLVPLIQSAILNAFLMTQLRSAFGIEGSFIFVGGLTLAGGAAAVLRCMRGGLRAAPSV